MESLNERKTKSTCTKEFNNVHKMKKRVSNSYDLKEIIEIISDIENNRNENRNPLNKNQNERKDLLKDIVQKGIENNIQYFSSNKKCEEFSKIVNILISNTNYSAQLSKFKKKKNPLNHNYDMTSISKILQEEENHLKYNIKLCQNMAYYKDHVELVNRVLEISKEEDKNMKEIIDNIKENFSKFYENNGNIIRFEGVIGNKIEDKKIVQKFKVLEKFLNPKIQEMNEKFNNVILKLLKIASLIEAKLDSLLDQQKNN